MHKISFRVEDLKKGNKEIARVYQLPDKKMVTFIRNYIQKHPELQSSEGTVEVEIPEPTIMDGRTASYSAPVMQMPQSTHPYGMPCYPHPMYPPQIPFSSFDPRLQYMGYYDPYGRYQYGVSSQEPWVVNGYAGLGMAEETVKLLGNLTELGFALRELFGRDNDE